VLLKTLTFFHSRHAAGLGRGSQSRPHGRWCGPFRDVGLFLASGALSRHAHFPDPEVFISWGPYKYVRNAMAKGGWILILPALAFDPGVRCGGRRAPRQ
jgi:hypothetical protein